MPWPRYALAVLLLTIAGCDDPVPDSPPESRATDSASAAPGAHSKHSGPAAPGPTSPATGAVTSASRPPATPPTPANSGAQPPSSGSTGSASTATQSPATPAGTTFATAEGASAETIAKRFCEHLNAGQGKEAGALLYFADNSAPIWVDRELGTVNKLSAGGGSGQSHFTFVEVHEQGVAAVAVINADKKNGQATTDYDPLYLVRLNGQCWVVPHLNNIKYAHPLVSQEEYADFSALEKWFDTRKTELAKK